MKTAGVFFALAASAGAADLSGASAGTAARGVTPSSATDLSRTSAREDGHLVDSAGRVRLFHGLNAVQKGYPWVPSSLQNETKLALYEQWGFNAVRVGMMWSGVEPEQGQWNQSYVAVMQSIVSDLGDHGLYSILDMHQDVGSSLWGSYDGLPLWIANQSKPEHAYPWPIPADVIAKQWGAGYLTEATGRGFQDLYDNANGERDAMGEFWSKVASEFKGWPEVLAYELINEPWSGDIYEDVKRLLPGVSGKENLMPLYDALNDVIRQEDNETMIMYEPSTYGMIFNNRLLGTGLGHVPGGRDFETRSCLSWHYYCWFMDESDPYAPASRKACDQELGPQVFDNIPQLISKTGGAAFLTEWGLCSPTSSATDAGTIECEFVMDSADAGFMSWTNWDSAFFDSDGNVKDDYVKPFIRAYPQAVQGTPTPGSLVWDGDSLSMSFSFDLDLEVSAPSVLFVPSQLYGTGGFTVVASPAGTMEVEVDGSVVTLTPTASAEDGATISVAVSQ